MAVKPTLICATVASKPLARNSRVHQERAKNPRVSSRLSRSAKNAPLIFVSVNRMGIESIGARSGRLDADQSQDLVVLLIERLAQRRNAFRNLFLDHWRVRFHCRQSFDEF